MGIRDRNSFINRNQIKTPQGALWLTIPIKTKGHTSESMRTTEIDDNQPWRTKHLKTIEMNYRRAPRFEICFPKIEELIRIPEVNLADYCLLQLRLWLNELSINTKVIRSSELLMTSLKSDLVLDLCNRFSAQRYLSGALGRNYLVENDFKKAGVIIDYQNYSPQIYKQLGSDFIPCLRILDWWKTELCVKISSKINWKK